jgi:hypothetical protein
MAISSVTFLMDGQQPPRTIIFVSGLSAPQSMRLLAAAYKRCRFAGPGRTGAHAGRHRSVARVYDAASIEKPRRRNDRTGD